MPRVKLPSSPIGGKDNLHEVDAPRHVTVPVRLSRGEAAMLDAFAKDKGTTRSAALRILLWDRMGDGSRYFDTPSRD